MQNDDNGEICPNCDEWFEVWYNNNGINERCFCPLCGYEFPK